MPIKFPDSKQQQFDAILEQMREGCASLLDFKSVFRIHRERDIPLSVFFDLLLEMEELELVERRYRDAMMRENPSDFLWFPVWRDKHGCKVTEPYFHRQTKLSATDRMDLYHGMASSDYAQNDYLSSSLMNQLSRIQYGAQAQGDASSTIRTYNSQRPTTGWKVNATEGK